MRTDVIRNVSLCALVVLAAIGVVLQRPIVQSPAYHQFADTTIYGGLPNGANVWSNLPLVIFGIAGIWQQLKQRIHFLWQPALVFFTGILLTGLGSAWYHLAPDHLRLVWDRLPMTVSFMGFMVLLCTVFISYRLSEWLLWPFCLLGIASVLYWYFTEQSGTGDLRFYVLVQFVPVVLTPVIVLWYPAGKSVKWYFGVVVIVYMLAKLAEHFDVAIYQVVKGFSGHTLKHLVSALAPFVVLLFFRKRYRQLHEGFKCIKNGNDLRKE